MKTGFWSRNRWCLVLTALLMIVSGFTLVGHEARQWALDAQESRLASLSVERDRKVAQAAEKTDQNVLAALGVTASRLDTDEKVIKRLLTKAFAWDSGSSYEQARTQLVERYGLSARDQFLRTFLPPARSASNAEGKQVYFLDERGLRSQLGDSLHVDVIGASGTDYRYVVRTEVAFRTGVVPARANGTKVPVPIVTRPMLINITVGGDGRITGLTGIPGGGPKLTSK